MVVSLRTRIVGVVAYRRKWNIVRRGLRSLHKENGGKRCIGKRQQVRKRSRLVVLVVKPLMVVR